MRPDLSETCGYCGGPFRAGELPVLAPVLGRGVHERCGSQLRILQQHAQARAANKARAVAQAASAPAVPAPADLELLLQQVPRLRELGVAEASCGQARIALVYTTWTAGPSLPAPAEPEPELEQQPEPPTDEEAFGASG